MNATKNVIKNARKIVNELNAVIARENLWVYTQALGKRRVINAHIFNGVPYVTDLYSGNAIKVEGNKFENGYGSSVEI